MSILAPSCPAPSGRAPPQGGSPAPHRPRPLRRRRRRAGMLHVAFARSDVARGRIVSTRHDAAQRGAGRRRRAHRRGPQRSPRDRWGRHRRSAWPDADRSRCSPTTRSASSATRTPWSSPTSRGLAEDALELIELDIEVLPPVADYDDRARRPPTSCIPTRRATVASGMPAPVDDELRAILDRRRARRSPTTFVQNRYLAVPMETRGIVASWDRTASRVRRLGVDAVAPRRPHRHGPHHRSSRAARSTCGWATSAAASAKGVPRARRADRDPRELPPRPAGEVDRGPRENLVAATSSRAERCTRHDGGRRRRHDPRRPRRPPRRRRRVPAGGQPRRDGRA